MKLTRKTKAGSAETETIIEGAYDEVLGVLAWEQEALKEREQPLEPKEPMQ